MFASFQLVSTLVSECEQMSGIWHIFGFVEHIVVQSIADSIMEDDDVRQQCVIAYFIDFYL